MSGLRDGIPSQGLGPAEQYGSGQGRDEISSVRGAPEHAVILAGGLGSRLWPQTISCPKALTSVGPCSVLEILLRQLRSAGVSRVSLCVSYLGAMIKRVIGDGGRFGLDVEYYTDPGLGTTRAVGRTACLAGTCSGAERGYSHSASVRAAL